MTDRKTVASRLESRLGALRWDTEAKKRLATELAYLADLIVDMYLEENRDHREPTGGK